jgi:hypothetical protein
MPWDNTREARRKSDATYKDPEYLRNRQIALRRAGGRCECTGECGLHAGPCRRRDRPLHTDHDIPRSQGGSHDHANLVVRCSGPGSCHAAKTARESNAVPRDPEPKQRTAW